MDDVRYRWIDGPTATDADWDRIESICAARGWASLNRQTSRVLLVERDGQMGFIVLQLFPMVGPQFLPPSMRGEGIAEELNDRMWQFLTEAQARGFLVVADSPHTEWACRARNMNEIKSPVFSMGGI